MNRGSFNGVRWQFESDSLIVRMDDATFQRHLNHYLEGKKNDAAPCLAVSPPSEEALQQRLAAIRLLSNPEHWRDCTDPDVRLFRVAERGGGGGSWGHRPHPLAASGQLVARVCLKRAVQPELVAIIVVA